MGLFDKVTKGVSSVGKGIAGAAATVGSSAVTATAEQSELVTLKSNVNVIKQELDSAYVQIGRRYVDYVLKTGEMPGIDVQDILKLIEPKLEKLAELEAQIVALEKQIMQKKVLREKQEVEAEFLAEKEKLDKALAMDLLSQEEYDAKLRMARKRVDHFEDIRRIQQQAEVGVITREEMNAKIQELLNS
ncbi:MAG: hypothetical protein E7553_07420 [Ruminococcaceae bacterium]|nr:hypothetical protein [Oscillospiraceae bacterium]